MAKKKKPTAMEIKNVINNMLHFMTEMQVDISKLNSAFHSYVEFKGDKEDLAKSLENKIKKGESNESNGAKSRNSSRKSKDTPLREQNVKGENITTPTTNQ